MGKKKSLTKARRVVKAPSAVWVWGCEWRCVCTCVCWCDAFVHGARANFSHLAPTNVKLFGNFLVHSSDSQCWAISTTNTVRWHRRRCDGRALNRSWQQARRRGRGSRFIWRHIKVLRPESSRCLSLTLFVHICVWVRITLLVCACVVDCVISRAFVSPVFTVYLGHCLSSGSNKGSCQDKRTVQSSSCVLFAGILINCLQLNSIAA